MKQIQLFHGDNVEVLCGISSNTLDAVVTDCPYGLKFMGKKWDYDVPSVYQWEEILRVLKPGGHLLSFGGTRTYHRLVVNIEDAGFEIRDQIQWLYGQGFPKSHNIGKKLDDWDGYGTALKPANEPICLARKPLSEKTIADNVLKWGVGGLNIDGCRISVSNSDPNHRSVENKTPVGKGGISLGEYSIYKPNRSSQISTQGRFPANILLDEEAAEMLDEQTGVIKSGGYPAEGSERQQKNCYGKYGKRGDQKFKSSEGGASRFFYVAKASKKERNAGLEGMLEKESGIKNNSGRGFSESDPYKKILNQNHHPTVKPIRLMEYLIKLICPSGGTVLDPFMGSGSTGIAAKNLGRKFIGIELDEEYFQIAHKRIGEA